MTLMTLIQYSLIILLFSGYCIVTYSKFALKRGWSVGEMLENDTSIVRSLGSIALIFSVITVFFYFQWYIAFLIIIVTFIVAYISTLMLKSKIQILTSFGLLVGIVLTLIYYLT